MPCILVALGLITPRLVLGILYLFTRYLQGVFTAPIWPILGFFFLPSTTLWYAVVAHEFGGQWTLWPVVGLVLALMIDVAPFSRRRKRR